MKKILFMALVFTTTIGSTFAQTDLWNQQTSGNYTIHSINEVNLNAPKYTTFVASNVVNNIAWNIGSISEVISSAVSPTGITSATLNIFQDGSSVMPGASDDPTKGSTVNVSIVSYSSNTNEYLMTASNLTLNLAAGDHWISLAPTSNLVASHIYEYGSQSNHAGASFSDAIINTGGEYSNLSSWTSLQGIYGGIDIHGAAQATPEPNVIFLGCLGLVGFAIRRHK